jgi:hypothetical protein
MKHKPKPQDKEQEPESDQVVFEKLPEETKELMKLKEVETKTSGSEKAVVTRKIQDKSQP